MFLLSTSQVADLLGVKRCNVNYYIRKGYLTAKVIDGVYKIDRNDYVKFRDFYFDTDRRFKNRGALKKMTHEQVVNLQKCIFDVKDDSITFEDFKTMYEKLNIPLLSELLVYKRDVCIRNEYKKGVSKKELSKKYNLRLQTIYSILKDE